MNYICNSCGKFKEKLKIIEEKYPYGDTFALALHYDTECECGGSFVKTTTCLKCQEYFQTDSIPFGLCVKCLSEFFNEKNCIEYIKSEHLIKEFFKREGTSEYLDLLNEVFERINCEIFEKLVEKKSTQLIDFVKEDIEDFTRWGNENGKF